MEGEPEQAALAAAPIRSEMSRNGCGASCAVACTTRIRPALLDDEEAVRGTALGCDVHG